MNFLCKEPNGSAMLPKHLNSSESWKYLTRLYFFTMPIKKANKRIRKITFYMGILVHDAQQLSSFLQLSFFFSCLFYFRSLSQIFHLWALWGKLQHARSFKTNFSNTLQLLKLLELERPLIFTKHGAVVHSSSVIWVILNPTSSRAEPSQITLVHRVWKFKCLRIDTGGVRGSSWKSLRKMGSRWREFFKAQKM